MMIILDPTLEERTVQPSPNSFSRSSRPAAAAWRSWTSGRRRLAYEIDKRAEGIYAVVDLAAEPETRSASWTVS